MLREDVEVLIEEIKQQMRNRRASLMIGAGFSRNADTASPSTPLPPTWSELKKVFVDKLYGKFSEQYREEMNNSKTVLQLAQEYDKLFERAGLNLLLRGLIRDAEVFPGSIHEEILRLPWRDVFTTNYDTLLERAATHVIERKYSPVYCCDDLALSAPPRIIKLHGSIHTDATPLIVTDEDYRCYPSSYAPFVNTVQQAIMETTLCLIGFSGTDPNFLKWIGWVRDNLKDSMPPIYLIGKLNISNSEYRVLVKYKINPVDLSVFDKNKSHKELLKDFIETIKPEPEIKWDLSSGAFSPSPQAIQDLNVRKQEIKALCPKWKKQREEYPNWLVVPHKYREKLVTLTENWIGIPKWCAELPPPEDIQLLYEYNWRMEHCLMPIINDNVEYYEKILRRHNPLEINDKFFTKGAFVPNDADRSTQCEMWIQLMFAVLRWQREEGQGEDFKEHEKILQSVVRYYPEYAERLYYERALFALSLPDIKILTQVMAVWKKHLSIPEWTLKYAALTAELGNSEEAAELLKRVLPTIRQSILKDCVKNDYFCLSLEGIILTALIAYEQGEYLFNRPCESSSRESGNDDITNDLSAYPVASIGSQEVTCQKNDTGINKSHKNQSVRLEDDYRQRLVSLRASYCDPSEELDIFRLSVSHSSQQKSGEIETRNFDTTTKSSHMVFGWDKSITCGYQFLRYLETTGIPLCFNHITFVDKTLTNAAKRVAPCSPSFAFAAFNRVGTTNQADYEYFFSQSIVYDISQEKADQLLARYINAAKWLMDNACDKINGNIANFYSNTLKKLTEAISRLMVKASRATLQSVFDWVMALYDCGIQKIVLEIPLRNCIKRLFESMPTDMLCANLEKLLQLPAPKNEADARFFVNPFEYVDKSKKTTRNINETITTALNTWFGRLDTDKDWLRKIALKVLFASDELGLMTNDQRKIFAQKLFSKLGGDGLPADTDFYPWVFLKVANFCDRVDDVEEKLLKRYKGFQFEFDCGNAWFQPADYRFEMDCYSMLLNMSVTRGAPEYRLSYDSNDAWEIFRHIKSAIEKLKSQIDKLLENEKPIAIKSIQNNLLHTDRIVGEIVIPAIDNQPQRLSQVKRFIQNAEKLHPFPTSKVALLHRDDEFQESLAQAFVLAISSRDRDIFNLYSWAMLNAYIRANKKEGPNVPPTVFHSLVTAVGMRSDNIFRLACQTITAVLDFYDMDQWECDLLLQYLEILEKETLFSTPTSRFPFGSRYDYRIAAGGLAARIYKAHYDKDANAIPGILIRWNEICHSLDEFPNLRKKWDEVVDHAQ